MSTTVGLCLEPLDVLFFRDGRPFTAASHGISGLPVPQTLAGALRTALLERAGCNFDKLRGASTFAEGVRRACAADDHWIGEVAFRGPWLARQQNGAENLEVLVPVPATLHRQKKQKEGDLYRLEPLQRPLPGWEPPAGQEGLKPLWLKQREPTEPAEGYLTLTGLQLFLRSDDVPAGAVVRPEKLFAFDHRTGIGIEPDRLAAQETLIYGASYLALREDVVFYAEAVLPDGILQERLTGLGPLAFGGQARRARLEVLQTPFNWDSLSGTAGSGTKPLLLLTTPGLFRERWRPTALATPELVAAAVPGALPVSGWDLAQGGPKRTRFAVQAGSVYFLDREPEGLPDSSLCDEAEDRAQGWGCYLKGEWSYA